MFGAIHACKSSWAEELAILPSGRMRSNPAADSYVCGVNRMISTRREGAPGAGSRVRGSCAPNPTAATFRDLNQPADWIACLSTRYLRTESACSCVRISARSRLLKSSV